MTKIALKLEPITVNKIEAFVQHVQHLPQRNFERLKAEEARIIADKVAIPDSFEIRRSFSDLTISGDLNYAHSLQYKSKTRRYYLYAIPYLLASSLTSLLALPGLILRTTYSALLALKNLFSKGVTEATDPFLENCLNLTKAMSMVVTGIIYAVVKLATCIFRDVHTLYQEKQEASNHPQGNIALIGVNPQKSFCLGGNFVINDKRCMVKVGVKLMQAAHQKTTVVLTKDWHCKNHRSYAANSGQPFTTRATIDGLRNQTLWPVYGMQGTSEAEFLDELPLRKVDIVVKKGIDPFVKCYGAFYDSANQPTELHDLLQGRNVKKVIVWGGSTDLGVLHTAKQAKHLGYEVIYVSDNSTKRNLKYQKLAHLFKDNMASKGIGIYTTDQVILQGKLSFPNVSSSA